MSFLIKVSTVCKRILLIFALKKAAEKLQSAISKLNLAINDPSIFRFLTLIDALTDYITFLEYLVALRNGKILIIYDREMSAMHAILHSRNNFETLFPYGNGNKVYDANDISKPDVRGTVGGDFTYPKDVLKHEQGFTGSAIFISEAIYAGYIPMTYGLDSNEEVDLDDCSQDTGSKSSGWHICEISPGATQSWKYHLDLINYFVDYDATLVGELTYNDYSQLIDLTNNGSLKDNGADNLYNLFNADGDFATLDTGDLMYVNLGTGADGNGLHSFLIVGWGEAVDTYIGVNAQLPAESQPNRVVISPIHASNTIPYISDFGYGYNGSKTGWLQDPRPRPFYSAAVTITSANLFQTAITGFASSDYLDRMRGSFSPFVFKNNTDCSNGCLPNWKFYHILPSHIQIPCQQIKQIKMQ